MLHWKSLVTALFWYITPILNGILNYFKLGRDELYHNAFGKY